MSSNARWRKRLTRGFGAALLVAAVLLSPWLVRSVMGDVPNTFADGQLISAAAMNANFAATDEDIELLKTAIGELEGRVAALEDSNAAPQDEVSDLQLPPVFASYVTSNSGTTTIANETIINYDTKAADSHNAVTTGSGWRFTAPRDGYYVMVNQLRSGSVSGGGCTPLIHVNGTPEVYTQSMTVAGTIGKSTNIVRLDAGDVDVRGVCGPSSTVGLQPNVILGQGTGIVIASL